MSRTGHQEDWANRSQSEAFSRSVVRPQKERRATANGSIEPLACRPFCATKPNRKSAQEWAWCRRCVPPLQCRTHPGKTAPFDQWELGCENPAQTFSSRLITLKRRIPWVDSIMRPSCRQMASFTSRMVPYCISLAPLGSRLVMANVLVRLSKHRRTNRR